MNGSANTNPPYFKKWARSKDVVTRHDLAYEMGTGLRSPDPLRRGQGQSLHIGQL